MTSGKKKRRSRAVRQRRQIALRSTSASRPKPGLKRSQYVAFGVVGALALACCGFGAFGQNRQCVDATRTVVDNSRCERGGTGARWYYGGSSSGKGTKATGGSYTRGGFGGRFFGGG
ncbi:hypothetical protein [Catellatospora tritici]|uniref:hypothetical protein n=1 Tax=Catellatospora tritici TaxID=2851566 RepID=UPI001C2D2342|nr:hypothetical protein [Catellatospora tritici]MBV1855296.1 hypothetical protein [Catellatospora tritici]